MYNYCRCILIKHEAFAVIIVQVIIKQHLLIRTYEITCYNTYIIVKGKGKHACLLKHMEFDTNSWIYTNTRLCSGQYLRPLSIKGTIQKVPTAKSPQLLLIYELTGLSMNSKTGQKMCLSSPLWRASMKQNVYFDWNFQQIISSKIKLL